MYDLYFLRSIITWQFILQFKKLFPKTKLHNHIFYMGDNFGEVNNYNTYRLNQVFFKYIIEYLNIGKSRCDIKYCNSILIIVSLGWYLIANSIQTMRNSYFSVISNCKSRFCFYGKSTFPLIAYIDLKALEADMFVYHQSRHVLVSPKC